PVRKAAFRKPSRQTPLSPPGYQRCASQCTTGDCEIARWWASAATRMQATDLIKARPVRRAGRIQRLQKESFLSFHRVLQVFQCGPRLFTVKDREAWVDLDGP